MFLNEDVFSVILDFLLMDITDFYKLRSVNQFFFSQCNKKWFQPIEIINPPRTMVNFKYCQVCEKYASRSKSLPYGWFPRPIYIHCIKFDCCRTVYRNIVENAKSQNICLLTTPAVKSEEGYCTRSDGSISECIFEKKWLWQGAVPKIRCMVDVKGSTGVKDILLSKLDPQLLTNYKILRL